MVTRKPVDLPPEVALSFVRAMNDYFAEADPHKQDPIAHISSASSGRVRTRETASFA